MLRKIAALAAALGLLLMAFPAMAQDALPYRVDVDLVNQIVTVYKNDGTDAIVLQALCSSGANGATPTGTFRMPEKKRESERTEWFRFRTYGGYARYATRIYKNVMFHSLLYTRPNLKAITQTSVQALGTAVSHGCIRMRWEDARFIAENCPVGTVVKIHRKGERDEELRELLLQSSYNVNNGLSYNAFLGIPDDPGVLGKGSVGDEVKNLQLRLKDLGIYTDEISGKYTLATVRAVREAQQMLGMAQTGAATLDFQAAIARPDAPSAMNVALQSGSSGPAVRALQENLRALRLYEGDVDSVYDVDVAGAVALFQGVYGFEADGVASPLVQKAIYYEAGRVKGVFAGGDDYTARRTERTEVTGKVKCRVGIKLRSEPTPKSEALMSLANRTTVVGLEYGEKWSKVMKNGVTGYVMNTFMTYRTQTAGVVEYLDADGVARFTLGAKDTEENPAEAFEAYLDGGGSLDAYADMRALAGALEETALKSRPSESAETAATMPAEAVAEVLLKTDEWTLLSYGGVMGYAPTGALSFSLGAEDEAEDAAVYEADAGERASIVPASGKAANVYESGDEMSAVLGTLKAGLEVEVLQTEAGWSLIEYKGRRGYVMEMELRFENE